MSLREYFEQLSFEHGADSFELVSDNPRTTPRSSINGQILIRGENGSGKLTLLHILRGILPLADGERRETNESLGVFTQDLARFLDVSARAVDLVTTMIVTALLPVPYHHH
mmetsp:Transcript_39874/g.96219  ORF Transcript_39874/g.96219 Transcript_39874/m.96219 type:complete len:111 (-) Transcript_39874:71-403(-)